MALTESLSYARAAASCATGFCNRVPNRGGAFTQVEVGVFGRERPFKDQTSVILDPARLELMPFLDKPGLRALFVSKGQAIQTPE